MLGECTFHTCTHPHAKCADVDGGFSKFVVDELSPGVAKLNRDGEVACRHRRGACRRAPHMPLLRRYNRVRGISAGKVEEKIIVRGVGVNDDESDADTVVMGDLTEGSDSDICVDSDESCEEEIKPRDGPSKMLHEGEGACLKALAEVVDERGSGASDGAVTKDGVARRRPPTPSNKSRANRLDPSPPSEGQTVYGANRPDPA